jgi:hypothetical protein
MKYYLSSSDPDNYGTIKFGTFTRGFTDNLKYRITNFTTTSAFMNTTREDYIKINGEKFYFMNKTDYKISTLAEDLTWDLQVAGITCYEHNGLFVYNSESPFTFEEWSYRAGLLMGFYNTPAPIEAVLENDDSYYVRAPSYPIINFGNVLYIKSTLPDIVGLNVSGEETQQNVAYKSIEFIYPGLPIVSRLEGKWVSIKSEHLNHVTFQLCDFMLTPIICRSPIFLTIEVSME